MVKNLGHYHLFDNARLKYICDPILLFSDFLRSP